MTRRSIDTKYLGGLEQRNLGSHLLAGSLGSRTIGESSKYMAMLPRQDCSRWGRQRLISPSPLPEDGPLDLDPDRDHDQPGKKEARVWTTSTAHVWPRMIPILAASSRAKTVQYFANPISNPIVDPAQGGGWAWQRQALLIKCSGHKYTAVRHWAASCKVHSCHGVHLIAW